MEATVEELQKKLMTDDDEAKKREKEPISAGVLSSQTGTPKACTYVRKGSGELNDANFPFPFPLGVADATLGDTKF
ncbi:hypothetical protein Bca4012_076131 [Brassica carinata]|uniref:Uncharacterized protein n=3 Tax=Brassica TaxID=3705 RepID=A0ABQ7E7M5_BRACR|nr:hypothetical protein DY000_02021741 [Brassica cretica]KAG2266423.1 hypothetical protein Bca52824_073502 [Brassica carinata]CAF1957386.1 unnamed protein product [Brassica napus]